MIKLPNSAKKAKKKFFLVAAENCGEWRRQWSRRRFLWEIPKLGEIIDYQKDFTQLSLKLRE